MKFQNLLFFSIFLMGCNTTPPVKVIDPRPATELALIKKFHVSDSLFTSESNEIKKKEVYDKQKTELEKFIIDALPAEVKEWHAIVYKIEVDDYIEVTLLIPESGSLNENDKYPQYDNIVLFSNESLNDSPVKTSLKELSKGDQVLVTGSFEKDEIGNPYLDSNMDDLGNRNGFIFSNPKINFKIKSITKQEVSNK
ncbi:hypothetical protein [Mucilaginibacter lappiensis]|uniref:Lipoprotein n=1 Tax=Mucilaginibacter lappiensis TaxID=354630 RepID=A0A1N6UVC1_9SPHI|nr:hypothetical protein [Mucilaginibacter lappiensis]MBB6108963.1 hypothetical protein [Mucilaginibacter lappiensis]MBB6130556.1 hypothetical protein [Mucilaginibacter lappiensis]SIQ69568.1 hypothetical protein SAMN05421821_103196 [Mucilaginibacter lappiensis]